MTKPKRILAGNWKLNKTPNETRRFLGEWCKAGPFSFSSIYFVPALCLEAAAQSISGFSAAHRPALGLQNIYIENSGAFTGENSGAVAKEVGATWVLIGHSERRTLFGETDEMVRLKLKTTVANGLGAMVCIGETLKERDGAETQKVLKKQIEEAFSGVSLGGSPLAIAYEPVWAIGTGRTASTAQVEEAHQWIREILMGVNSQLESVPLLYGGSVKPDNALELSKVSGVDGFLVGGASLKVDSMLELAKALN